MQLISRETFGIVLILCCVFLLTNGTMDGELFLAIVAGLSFLLLFTTFYPIHEFFGMSPGTMDQLKSTHVTTQEDLNYYSFVLPKVIRKEITAMTGGDPGVLQTRYHPLGGAYVPMG